MAKYNYTPFYALPKEKQEEIRQMRLKSGYHYKKEFQSRDETYYNNVYLENN